MISKRDQIIIDLILNGEMKFTDFKLSSFGYTNIVSTKIIELILKRELKFTDFNFIPLTWYDGFTVELLRWYDKQVDEIPLSKHFDVEDENYDNWKTYYEQIVRILYYFVVYKQLSIYECLLRRVFDYLVDNLNFFHVSHYSYISSNKLMEVYQYIYSNIPRNLNILREEEDVKMEPLNDLLIGRWKNEEMENKLNNIVISVTMNSKKKYKNNFCQASVIINDDKYK